jgi:hypothetical protein
VSIERRSVSEFRQGLINGLEFHDRSAGCGTIYGAAAVEIGRLEEALERAVGLLCDHAGGHGAIEDLEAVLGAPA